MTNDNCACVHFSVIKKTRKEKVSFVVNFFRYFFEISDSFFYSSQWLYQPWDTLSTRLPRVRYRSDTFFSPLILPFLYILQLHSLVIAMEDSQDSSSSTCGIVKHNISLKLSILHIFYSNYDAVSTDRALRGTKKKFYSFFPFLCISYSTKKNIVKLSNLCKNMTGKTSDPLVSVSTKLFPFNFFHSVYFHSWENYSIGVSIERKKWKFKKKKIVKRNCDCVK